MTYHTSITLSDRELLELAAKAAGMEVKAAIVLLDGTLKGLDVIEGGKTIHYWHPLIDDGDALRLAVKIGMMMQVFTNSAEPSTFVYGISHGPQPEFLEAHNGDAGKATRRAIVRAAAAIALGRAMP